MDVGSIILQLSTATHHPSTFRQPPQQNPLQYYSLLIFTLTPSHLISSLQSFKSFKSFQAFQAFKTISLDATTYHHQKTAQIQGPCVHS